MDLRKSKGSLCTLALPPLAQHGGAADNHIHRQQNLFFLRLRILNPMQKGLRGNASDFAGADIERSNFGRMHQGQGILRVPAPVVRATQAQIPGERQSHGIQHRQNVGAGNGIDPQNGRNLPGLAAGQQIPDALFCVLIVAQIQGIAQSLPVFLRVVGADSFQVGIMADEPGKYRPVFLGEESNFGKALLLQVGHHLSHRFPVTATDIRKAVIADLPVAQHNGNAVAGGLNQLRIDVVAGVDNEAVHLPGKQCLYQTIFQFQILLAVYKEGNIARVQQRVADGANHAGTEGAGNIRHHHTNLHRAVGPQGLGDGIGVIVGHTDNGFNPGAGIGAHQIVLAVEVAGDGGFGHAGRLGYAVYTPLEEIEEPELEFFSPKEGDPSDYVRIKLKSGKRVTITNSCAANVLGYVKEGDYSRGNVESARKCIQPLADYIGVSVEECCRQILHKAYEHIEPIILNFAEKYKIDRDQIDLVGCGGGASALLPYSAEQLNMRYSLAKHAEVISSIGVALAMIRDVVERVIPNPTTEDIRQIKKEAKEMAIKNGAVPDTIEVQVEIDNQTSKVTAIAMGSNEVQATDLKLRCDINEARTLAANSMRCQEQEVEDLVRNDVFYVFGHQNGPKHNVRVVDHRGFVKVQCGDAIAEACIAKDWEKTVTEMWEKTLYYKNEMARTPDFFLCIGGKVLDFTSSQNLEQLLMVMRSEFLEADENEGILLVASRTEIL